MKFFERTFQVGYPEVDAFKRVKLSQLIEWCTTVYYEFGEQVGIDEAYLQRVGGNWIVDEAAAEFTAYPHYHDRILVRGSVESYNRFFVYWQFEILNDEQQPLGTIQLAMSLLDLKTRKLVMIPTELGAAFEGEKSDHIKRFTKTELEGLSTDPSFEVTPRFSLLDYNGHVFNGHYYDWWQDSLPLDFLQTHIPHTITVRFEEEIRAQETVGIFLKQTNETSVHAVKGKNLKAVATINWQLDEVN